MRKASGLLRRPARATFHARGAAGGARGPTPAQAVPPATAAEAPAEQVVLRTEAPASNGDSTQKKSRGRGGLVAVGAVGVLGVAGAAGYKYQQSLLVSAPRLPPAQHSSQQAKDAKDTKEPEEVKEAVTRQASTKEATAASSSSDAGRADEEAEKAAAVAAAEKAAAEKTLAQALSVAAGVAAEAAARGLEVAEKVRAEGLIRREESFSALKDALDSRDIGVITQALAAARQAGVGVCAEVQLAESIVEPARLIREGLQCEEMAKVLLLPQEFRGLTEEAAIAAEKAACSAMDVEQLRARVVELSRFLAAARLHAEARIEDTLMTRFEAADAASLKLLEDGLLRLAEERDAAAAKEIVALEEQLQRVHEEEVMAARAEAAREAEEELAIEKERLQAAAELEILEEKGAHCAKVAAMRDGLAKVEEMLKHEAGLVQKVQAHNNLAVAVLSVEDAIVAQNGAHSEFKALRSAAEGADPFSAGVIAHVPEDINTVMVPPASTLQQHFAEGVEELMVAAFVPPGSGLLGQAFGRLFRRLYVLDGRGALEPAAVALEDDEHCLAVKQNLDALARASVSPRGTGALSAAVVDLEASLVGPCRELASDWLSETRKALLVHQALLVVKARAHCLTSAQS
mmetsp:Transcript_72282/g.200512  ORF Transcript_72282/g.200512 Transcript_72282/m.200512 type:complete len:631 (+) Transcript_72282:65-1957(+)